MHPRLKIVGVAAAVAAAALVGSACSTVNPSAATVNGDSLDRSSFNDTLHQFADNPAFIARVSSAGQAAVTGNGSDTVSADFARQALQREIVVLVARQENKARGATITPDIEAAARDDVQTQFGLEAFESFPKSFQDLLVEQNAQIFALRAAVAGSTLADDALQKVFEEDPSQFAEVCASHILVNTKDEADAVEDRLASGEDFGAVAQDVSIDSGSAGRRRRPRLHRARRHRPPVRGCAVRDRRGRDIRAGADRVRVPRHQGDRQEGAGVRGCEAARASEGAERLEHRLQRRAERAASRRRSVTVDPRYGMWNESINAVVPTDLAGIEDSTATTSAGGS